MVIAGTGHGRLAYHPEVDGAVSGGSSARLVDPDSEEDYASIRSKGVPAARRQGSPAWGVGRSAEVAQAGFSQPGRWIGAYMDRDRSAPTGDLAVGAWLAIAAGCLMVVGCLLPWVSFTTDSAASLQRHAFQFGPNLGFSADGVIGVGLGLVTVLLEGHRFVFASKGGADTNPDWYHNLVAHPDVSVEVGTETLSATADPLQGAGRDRAWAVQVSRFPHFAGYQAKTERVIPVVELR